MSCLFIYTQDAKLRDFRSLMHETFPSEEYFVFNTNTKTVDEVANILKKVTSCVISPGDRTHIVSFIVGYILGNNFPIYTASDEFRSMHKGLDLIYNFRSESELYGYIRTHHTEIARADRMRVSKNYLYKLGIPFTAQNFIDYLKKNDIEMCDHFINAGMDVNCRNSNGTPALNVVCRKDDIMMVKYLIKHNATIDIVSTDREYTPLMDAVWRGNVDIARILINKGADVNKVSKEGQTMIVLAVGQEKLPLIKLLAENGADVDTADAMGMSAWNYATLFKKQQIIDILQQYHKEG